MRVKRAPGAQQLIGEPGGVRSGEGEFVRDRGQAGLRAGERTSECVPGARVPRLARRVAIPAQRSGSGSASQPKSSVPKASGRSSCGKCPAPSITRQR